MLRQTCIVRILAAIVFVLLLPVGALAQQTTGGITGLVTDAQGGILPSASVEAVGDENGLKRTQLSGNNGYYAFANLPLGHYTLTVTHEGFEKQVFPGIAVESGRTGTVNVTLTIGAVTQSVTVNAVPLLNAVDTTNGYVLDKMQIESIPLPTGSPLGTAILSPGVDAELAPGSGVNAGLGNPPIWANGQRDTSNSFSLNGVDGSSLFNGKSTSEVGSARVINSTGVSTSLGGGGVISSTASVYLSIGNAIPTPAPEMVEEVRVNASMYDAQQGATSGAHIDLSTTSGTNSIHGSLYGRRGTNWLNADPFFFNNDLAMPSYLKNPELHRYVAGGTVGGPIIKDKLFGFLAYQHLHVSDQEIGDSFLDVPVGLSDTNRTASGLAGLVNQQFDGNSFLGYDIGASDIDAAALALLESPALPGEPGKWLVPNDTESGFLSTQHGYDAILPGTGRFKADIAVANLDWNATAKDTVAFKYYYQHDPTLAPYAFSSVPGFTEHLDSGSQVAAINNTFQIKPNLSTTENIGILREKTWADNEQPWGPGAIPYCASGTAPCANPSTIAINTFGSTYFPGVSIYDVYGASAYNAGFLPTNSILNIGQNAEGQSSNTGAFQNRIQPSGDAIWTLGKHTVSFGGTYSYTQLNTIDKRTGKGTIATSDFSGFAQGYVSPGSGTTGFYVTSFLDGNASRYYRANQVGTYVQDKFQATPTLSLTAGVRYDWDGGLTEKYGRIYNFDPSHYSYTPSPSETPGNIPATNGLVIAGNNPNGTSGVSPTTLTGRQWGIEPRLGAAWQPEMFHSKVVVRTGFGMYYDRGELFSYFSPGYALGTVTGGPFGVNQSMPFVTDNICPAASVIQYEGFIPACGGGDQDNTPAAAAAGDLENPYGTAKPIVPSNPKSSDLSGYLPNLAAISNGGQTVSLGVYDRANKLPYTYNFTLDVQWQPRNDLAIDIGYTGNLGRHQVIPVPFNQAGIASASHPINGEIYTYGYTVEGPAGCASTFSCNPLNLPNGKVYDKDYEGGNVDHRVPYIGYASESIDYKAAGVDAYHALTAHIDKRMSHGVQVSASYTYSHALDEQSGLGLFYNGNNPLNLRDGYASADFDRTHVINFNYVFRVPDVVANKHSLEGYAADGWSLVGLTVLQSGQPYSVIDFSGAVGSMFYSTFNAITNPIVPLAQGCTPKNALTGHSGAFVGVNPNYTALNPACFTIPSVPAGGMGGAIPSNDPFETNFTSRQRNIFRQAFQKRADASLVKMTNFTERYALKFTFDVYNLTNTTSFDVPGNEVSQNAFYNQAPELQVSPGVQQPVLPGTCNAQGVGTVSNSFYSCPTGLGIITHTIGSPRQVQMSLDMTF